MKLSQRLAIGYIQTKFKLLRALSRKRAAEKAFDLFCTPYLKARRKGHPPHAELIQFTMPAQLKKEQQLTIRGYRWNHPAKKRVLILHGFGSAAYKFEAYARPLVQKGYEVLAFDAPAHGRSDGKRTHAVEYSAMIRQVVEHFGPVQGFMAHSFGGIALSLALEELEHDNDSRIVFIAPATETSSAVDAAFNLLKLKDPEVRREFERIIRERSGKPVEWFSIRRAMKHIRSSVLWIHDEGDTVTPWADAEKVKEDRHAHIRFLVTQGLGHQKIYRDENVKKAATDFL
ncbi:MAG: alpha/beta fold hydrolase [Chitinophagaceae bacterium]|nr:alpha/beta fold hydrolase [Chitinophagaceae bacterium]